MRTAARVTALTWRWNGDHVGQRPALGRLTSHVALASVVLVLVLLGGRPWWNVFSPPSEAAGNLSVDTVAAHSAAVGGAASSNRVYYRSSGEARVLRRATSHTAIPERPRLELTTYTVQVGDTAQSIAEKFGLQPTTLMWSNPEVEKAPDILKVGQTMVILPIDGVYHTIEDGDTLQSLADKYKVTVDVIENCEYNEIPTDSALQIGEKLIVPGGTKPFVAREVTTYAGVVPEDVEGSGIFYWPTAGYLTQGYWYGHRAIDLGTDEGTAVVSSDAGYVSFAGWTDIGYGYLIVIDHGNGYQTYYAHLSNFFVVEGQSVSAGEVIGAVGNTGNSTGPHLHFEVRYNGYPVNPLIYLP